MLIPWKKYSRNKYVLYGPPGVGKNSLARLIPTKVKDASVIHLEEVARNSRAKLLQQLTYHDFSTPLFVTAADLPPEQIPPEFGIIFILHGTLAEYQQQYNARNAIDPGKAGQDEDNNFGWMEKKRRTIPDRFRLHVNPRTFHGQDFEGNPSGLLDLILQDLGIAINL